MGHTKGEFSSLQGLRAVTEPPSTGVSQILQNHGHSSLQNTEISRGQVGLQVLKSKRGAGRGQGPLPAPVQSQGMLRCLRESPEPHPCNAALLWGWGVKRGTRKGNSLGQRAPGQ